jgi:hypothetical protein
VDGFKTDQKEIESVIVRTLHNLDELEENAVSARKAEQPAESAPRAESAPVAAPSHSSNSASNARASSEKMEAPEGRATKEELDIF